MWISRPNCCGKLTGFLFTLFVPVPYLVSLCVKRPEVWCQSYEAYDLTVWIILYISPYNYVISLELKLFLSDKFGCQKFGEGVY